jgi:hypothetical protein
MRDTFQPHTNIVIARLVRATHFSFWFNSKMGYPDRSREVLATG